MMDTSETPQCENNKLERFNRFYFAYHMKTKGYILAIFFLLLLILNKAVWDIEWIRHLSKTFLVIGLLVVGLSKEKVEDELMKTLRYYSFKYAFVAALLLSLATPYLEYFIDSIFSFETAILKENKGFFTVFQLVVLQQVYFYMLKAFYNEK